MKIQYPRVVRVVRHRTINAALEACYGRRHIHLPFLPHKKGSKLDDLLERALWQSTDGDERIYKRVLAFVVVEREMSVADFLKMVTDEGYEPASLSEGLALAHELIEQDVEPTTLFHLGASLRDDEYREYRLESVRGGEVRFIPYFSGVTKLKPRYTVVVARKEEKK